MLGKIVDTAGPDVSVVSLHGGPHVLTEAFTSHLGSAYRKKSWWSTQRSISVC